MTDPLEVTSVWCGALAQCGPAVAWTFPIEAVDRMGIAWNARRRTRPRADAAPLESPVSRFGEERPQKARPRSSPDEMAATYRADGGGGVNNRLKLSGNPQPRAGATTMPDAAQADDATWGVPEYSTAAGARPVATRMP
jgi:hypothetical protein